MGPTLRASCDSCNLAKVKCSKHPEQCARCKKHNIDCVYGISLRAGKRAAALPKKDETLLPLPTNWNMDFGPTTPYSPLDMDLCPSMFEFDMPLALEPYGPNRFFPTDEAFTLMPDLSFPDTTHATSVTGNGRSPNSPPVIDDSTFSFSTAMIYSDHTGNDSSSLFAFCGCFSTTIHTLSNLQQLADSAHTSFDVALAHNKEAVSLCLSTLNCKCASDSTIVLLLASLLAKIINIYLRPCGAWNAVEHRNPSHDSKGITARLILGVYNVDEGDEEMLKTEIVKMELRKVERVVSRLRDHLSSGTSEPEQRVHESLVEFLSEKLSSAFS